MLKEAKEETTEERLERFAREYWEILDNRTEEDDVWTSNFVVNYVKENAKTRWEYPQKTLSFNVGCAIKDADYEAKDAVSGDKYRSVWAKQFVESADTYYAESADTYYAEWLIYG
jgi:hypothetical protein